MTRGTVLVIALLSLAACDRRVTRDECVMMLDKYLDMTLGDADDLRRMAEPQASGVRAARRQSAKGHPAFGRVSVQCQAEVGRRQYDCAMAAHNADEWQACID